MTDAELAAGVVAGERWALDHLIERYHRPLLRYLWQAGGSREDAEDLACQALLRARHDMGRFSGIGSLNGWMFRIAFRELLRHRRRQAITRLYRPPIGRRPEPEDAVVLSEALAKLPLDQRAAFLLTEVEGLSVQEAAVALDVPAGTVKSRTYHARQKLKALLCATYGEANVENATE